MWCCSLAREGPLYPRVPWNVAFEHECQIVVSSRPPRNTHADNGIRSCDVRSGLIWRSGDGGSAPAVRGYRHFEEGREGVCPDPGAWPDAHGGDSDDVGRDEQPDPGAA